MGYVWLCLLAGVETGMEAGVDDAATVAAGRLIDCSWALSCVTDFSTSLETGDKRQETERVITGCSWRERFGCRVLQRYCVCESFPKKCVLSFFVWLMMITLRSLHLSLRTHY